MPKHLIALLFLIASPAWAEIEPVPERVQGEGPFSRLILRGVNVVTGEGAPAYGPMDVVIEGDRIVKVESVGYAGVPIEDEDRPAVSVFAVLDAEAAFLASR